MPPLRGPLISTARAHGPGGRGVGGDRGKCGVVVARLGCRFVSGGGGGRGCRRAGAILGARSSIVTGVPDLGSVGTAGRIRTAGFDLTKVTGMIFIFYLAQWIQRMEGRQFSSRFSDVNSSILASISPGEKGNKRMGYCARGRGGAGINDGKGVKCLGRGWIRDQSEKAGGDCGPHAVLMAVQMMCSRYPSLFDFRVAPSTIAEVRAISAVLVASGDLAADLELTDCGPEQESLLVEHLDHFGLRQGETQADRLGRICHLIRVDEQGPVRPVWYTHELCALTYAHIMKMVYSGPIVKPDFLEEFGGSLLAGTSTVLASDSELTAADEKRYRATCDVVIRHAGNHYIAYLNRKPMWADPAAGTGMGEDPSKWRLTNLVPTVRSVEWLSVWGIVAASQMTVVGSSDIGLRDDRTGNHETPSAFSLRGVSESSSQTHTAPKGVRRSGKHRSRGITDRELLRRNEEWQSSLPTQATDEAIMESARTAWDIRGKISVEQDLRVATLNVNGLTDLKIASIVWWFRTHAIDVLFLIDARVSEKSGVWYGETFKERLGVGTWTGSSPYVRAGGVEAGGQFIIVGPTWGGAVRGFECDRSGLGVATKLQLVTGGRTVLLMGTYWPWHQERRRNESCALEVRMRKWMKKAKQQGLPVDYVKGVLEKWHLAHVGADGEGTIIAGDLNAGWRPGTGGIHKGLSTWAHAMGLDNGPVQIGDAMGIRLNTRLAGRGTMVDHILYGGPDCYMECVGAWVDSGLEMRKTSDHLPLVAEFKVQGGRGTEGIVQKSNAKGPLEATAYRGLEGAKQELKYTKEMRKICKGRDWGSDPNRDTGAELLDICLESAAVGRKVMRVGRKSGFASTKRKGGWSPFIVGVRIHLDFLLSILQQARGQSRQHRWRNKDEVSAGIRAECDRWRSRLKSVKFKGGIQYSEGEVTEFMEVTGFNTSRWVCEISDSCQAEKRAQIELAKVKAFMHGKDRLERRTMINQQVSLREEIRAKGRIGILKRALLGEVRGAGIARSLRDSNGRILTDPVEILAATRSLFVDWHSQLAEYVGKGVHDEESWREGYDDLETFIKQQAHTGVPRHVLVPLWQGMTELPAVQAAKLEISEAILRTPSLDDFLREVKALKKRSAPGFTGLDYNMIKQWPEELLTLVHKDLSDQWSRKEIPDFWRWRWLCPIPKKQKLDDLNNLRPLMLNETIRKLWCRLIFKPIQHIWSSHGLLSPNQHGGTYRKGTDTANIEFINLVEEAYRDGTTLFLSSWDMKRAFDTMSIAVKQMAWHRMGVPADAVTYLTNLDRNNVTVVRTPLTAHIWHKQGYEGLDHRGIEKGEEGGDVETRGFTAERGTGQGDVLSPPLWIAMFDILLRALAIVDEKNKEELLRIPNAEGGAYLVRDQAYMDDLFSSSLSMDGLQRKADVVSGFCIVFGIKISEGKLRRMIINGRDTTCPLKVHSYGWVEMQLPEDVSERVTNLGVEYENDMCGKAELAKAVSEVERTALLIRNSRASADVKVEVMERCILWKLVYSSKFCALPLAEYRKVDKLMDGFYRAATKNMRSFPADLIHLRKQKGGLGIKRFSDVVQQEKWGMLRRSMYGDEITRQAMRRMVQRGGVSGDVGGEYDGHATVGGAVRPSWVTSLLEWAAEAGLFLHWRGLGVSNGPDEYWVGSNTSSKKAAAVANSGVQVVGDVVEVSSGQLQWRIPHDILGDRASDLKERPPPEGGVTLRIGQIWGFVVDGKNETCYEIKSLQVNQGSHYMLCYCLNNAEEELLRRSSTDANIVAFPFSSIAKVSTRYLTSPSLEVDGGITYAIVQQHCAQSPSWPQTFGLGPLEKAVAALPSTAQLIFSDGSWHANKIGLESTFLTSALGGRGAGGLVVWDKPSGAVVTFRVEEMEGIGAESAFTAEYVMMALGMKISRMRGRRELVCGDCEGVIKGLRMGIKKATKGATDHTVLLDDMIRSRGLGVPYVKWVKAHPEEYKTRDKWNDEDWGIFLADKVAGDKIQEIADMGFKVTQHAYKAREIYDGFIGQGAWYWGDEGGQAAGVGSLVSNVLEGQLKKYLGKRDAYRAQRGAAPYWFDHSVEFASVVWNLVGSSVGKRARSIRILFDKHDHGGNRAKGAKGHEHEETAMCEICGAVDSQEHWLCECNHPELVLIREEARANVQELIRQSSEVPELLHVARHFIDNLQLEDRRRLWMSNWSGDMRKKLWERMSDAGLTGRDVHVALVHCGKILARAAHNILTASQAIIGCIRRGKLITKAECDKLAKKRERQDRRDKKAQEGKKAAKHRPKTVGRYLSIDGKGVVELGRVLTKAAKKQRAERGFKMRQRNALSAIQGRKLKKKWNDMCDKTCSQPEQEAERQEPSQAAFGCRLRTHFQSYYAVGHG